MSFLIISGNLVFTLNSQRLQIISIHFTYNLIHISHCFLDCKAPLKARTSFMDFVPLFFKIAVTSNILITHP